MHERVKVGLSPSKEVCFICFNESSLKMIKNASYFILKALFIFEILKFLSQLFCSCGKTASFKKAKVNFKFYSVTTSDTNNENTSQEVKAVRQWNVRSRISLTRVDYDVFKKFTPTLALRISRNRKLSTFMTLRFLSMVHSQPKKTVFVFKWFFKLIN